MIVAAPRRRRRRSIAALGCVPICLAARGDGGRCDAVMKGSTRQRGSDGRSAPTHPSDLPNVRQRHIIDGTDQRSFVRIAKHTHTHTRRGSLMTREGVCSSFTPAIGLNSFIGHLVSARGRGYKIHIHMTALSLTSFNWSVGYSEAVDASNRNTHTHTHTKHTAALPFVPSLFLARSLCTPSSAT